MTLITERYLETLIRFDIPNEGVLFFCEANEVDRGVEKTEVGYRVHFDRRRVFSLQDQVQTIAENDIAFTSDYRSLNAYDYDNEVGSFSF